MLQIWERKLIHFSIVMKNFQFGAHGNEKFRADGKTHETEIIVIRNFVFEILFTSVWMKIQIKDLWFVKLFYWKLFVMLWVLIQTERGICIGDKNCQMKMESWMKTFWAGYTNFPNWSCHVIKTLQTYCGSLNSTHSHTLESFYALKCLDYDW